MTIMGNKINDSMVFAAMQTEWNRLESEELPYTLLCTSYAGEFIERFSTEYEAREKARAYRDSDSDSMPVEISCNGVTVWESKSGLTL